MTADGLRGVPRLGILLSSPMGSLSIGTLLGEIPRALTGESPIRKRKLTGAAAACSLAKTAEMFGTIPMIIIRQERNNETAPSKSRCHIKVMPSIYLYISWYV